MGVFLQALRADFGTPTPFFLWIFLTVIVGLAGPFGTYPTFDLAHRLLFWAVNIGLCLVFGAMMRALVYGVMGLRRTLAGSALIALILALGLPVFIYGSIRLLLGPAYSDAPSPLELSLFVFCTSLGISAYRAVTRAKVAALPPAPAPASEPERLPRLIRRLPPDRRGALISLSVRDHYVDVTTSRGRVSLLLRLGDAVDEVDGVDGAQVHRSHWVAWAAVAGIERAAGKLTLLMQDGSRVPVSKTYRDLVEARGFGIARATVPPHEMASAAGPNSPSKAGSSAQSPPV